MKSKILNIKTASLFLILCNIVLTYYFKYSHNSIVPLDFSIYNIGNLYNLISFIILFTGSAILFYRNKEIIITRTVFILSIFLIVFLLLSLFFTNTDFTWLKSYLFGYSAKKVLIASLLSANGLLQIYMLIIVWSKLLGSSNFVFIKAVYVSMFVFIIMLALSFLYIVSFKSHNIQSNSKFKVCVILGAAVWSDNKPSPLFSQRIKKGFELYNNGIVNYLQVTGGSAPGEITEAQAAKNLLIDYGVDEKKILLEENTSTTSEQMKFIKDSIIIPQKIDSIIIVSDKFHLCRVMEISSFYSIKIKPVPSDFKLSWEKYLYYHIRESIGLLFFWLFAI